MELQAHFYLNQTLHHRLDESFFGLFFTASFASINWRTSSCHIFWVAAPYKWLYIAQQVTCQLRTYIRSLRLLSVTAIKFCNDEYDAFMVYISLYTCTFFDHSLFSIWSNILLETMSDSFDKSAVCLCLYLAAWLMSADCCWRVYRWQECQREGLAYWQCAVVCL